MIHEVHIAGMFLSSLVPTAIAGLIGTALLRRGLLKWGLYRLVWHPALVDTALFFILWAAIVSLSTKV